MVALISRLAGLMRSLVRDSTIADADARRAPAAPAMDSTGALVVVFLALLEFAVYSMADHVVVDRLRLSWARSPLQAAFCFLLGWQFISLLLSLSRRQSSSVLPLSPGLPAAAPEADDVCDAPSSASSADAGIAAAAADSSVAATDPAPLEAVASRRGTARSTPESSGRGRVVRSGRRNGRRASGQGRELSAALAVAAAHSAEGGAAPVAGNRAEGAAAAAAGAGTERGAAAADSAAPPAAAAGAAAGPDPAALHEAVRSLLLQRMQQRRMPLPGTDGAEVFHCATQQVVLGHAWEAVARAHAGLFRPPKDPLSPSIVSVTEEEPETDGSEEVALAPGQPPVRVRVRRRVRLIESSLVDFLPAAIRWLLPISSLQLREEVLSYPDARCVLSCIRTANFGDVATCLDQSLYIPHPAAPDSCSVYVSLLDLSARPASRLGGIVRNKLRDKAAAAPGGKVSPVSLHEQHVAALKGRAREVAGQPPMPNPPPLADLV